MSRRIAIATLLLVLASSIGAQPVPEAPRLDVWITGGGAVGETMTLSLRHARAGNSPYPFILGFSHRIGPGWPSLSAPIHVLAQGQVGVSTLSIGVAIPMDNRLVGLPVHLQGLAVVHGWPTFIFYSHVCTWLIAPPGARRFVPVGQNDLGVRPDDGHARTALGDGTALFCGGTNIPVPSSRRSAAVYDSGRMTTTPVGNMTVARSGHVACRLGDGTVLVVGGDNPSAPTAELYNPRLRRFAPLGRVPCFVTEPTATVFRDALGNDFVLIAGGNDTGPSNRAMLYDGRTGRFSALPAMARPRDRAAAVAVGTGMVLITGGREASRTHDDAEMFILATGRFHPWGKLGRPRYDHALVSLGGGRAVVVGGGDSQAAIRDLEVFDAALARSIQLPIRLRLGRFGVQPVLLADGSVLVAGGESRAPSLRPGRMPEVLTLGGSTPLRPIAAYRPGVAVQAVGRGGVLAFTSDTLHQLR